MKLGVKILLMVLLIQLQVFSQEDSINSDSSKVWVEVIEGDTIVMVKISHARVISNELIQYDSLREMYSLDMDKIENYKQKAKEDSLTIHNQSIMISKKDSQNKKVLDINERLTKRLDLKDDSIKHFKNQRWLWGGVGILIGTAVGVTVAVIATN